jgi:hypothetical protein
MTTDRRSAGQGGWPNREAITYLLPSALASLAFYCWRQGDILWYNLTSNDKGGMVMPLSQLNIYVPLSKRDSQLIERLHKIAKKQNRSVNYERDENKARQKAKR